MALQQDLEKTTQSSVHYYAETLMSHFFMVGGGLACGTLWYYIVVPRAYWFRLHFCIEFS